ncbi:MAG: putative metal-dependent hydrolase, TIM-barrel fold, partial [Bryobacterales bacterium]|nr:putative metal-dependent hydrolase, TIM-barrel fold [Bryobacterales bacterium]
MRMPGILLVIFTAIGALAQPPADYHQHLFHPAVTGLAPDTGTITASELVAYLDAAGIRRALVLSVAYQFGNPNRPTVQDEYAKVRAENDWTSEQVARFPDRLRGFCGFNPLRDYALRELARCAQDPRLHYGIKLHFGNSDVDLDNSEHVARLRHVFREANRRRMAIVVHMRSSVTRERPYGAKAARVFLRELLPAAPSVSVQIAHLSGAGGYDDPAIDEALGVFVDAIAKHDQRMAHVYFDISGITGIGQWKERGTLIATRVRELGLGRVLYGSDGAVPGNTPREHWTRFRQLPLSDAEFRAIEGNIPPY